MQALQIKEKQKDLLNLAALPSIKKVLLPKETIVFSGEIFKYFKDKKMKRRIFMSNIHFFTLGKKFLTGNASIKRRIPYKNFQLIVSAKKSSELLIGTNKFELRMATADKEGIIQYLMEGYWEQAKKDFPIYYIDDFTLEKFQQLKEEKRTEELKTMEVQWINPSKLQEQMNQNNQVSAKLFESLVDSLAKFDLDGPLTRKLTMQRKIISEEDSSDEEDEQKDLIEKDDNYDSEEYEILGENNLNVILEQDEEQLEDQKQNQSPLRRIISQKLYKLILGKKLTKKIDSPASKPQAQFSIFEKLLRKLNILEKEEKYYPKQNSSGLTSASLIKQKSNKLELTEIFEKNEKKLQRLEQRFQQEIIDKQTKQNKIRIQQQQQKEEITSETKLSEQSLKLSPKASQETEKNQNQPKKLESMEISQNCLETIEIEQQYQTQEEFPKIEIVQEQEIQIEEITEPKIVESIQINIHPPQNESQLKENTDNKKTQVKINESQPQSQEQQHQSSKDTPSTVSHSNTSSIPNAPKLIFDQSIKPEASQQQHAIVTSSFAPPPPKIILSSTGIPTAPKLQKPIMQSTQQGNVQAPPPLSLLTAQVQQKQPKTIQFDWAKMPSVHQKEGLATVWQQHQEGQGVAIQFDDLEKQFAKKNATVNKTQTPKKVESFQPKNICLLTDSKKAYNMNISLSAKLKKISMEQLQQALIDVDFNIINTDIAETLSQFIPTFDEIQFFKSCPGPQENIDLASQFMLTICQIPRYPIRLRMTIFKSEFEERCRKLLKQISIIETANTNVKNNIKFIGFLKIVLDLGNQMNQGTNIGKAKGFKIGSLQKLLDIKASAGSQTLFDYLMHKLYEQQPDLLTFADDFAMLDDAVKIELQALIIDIQQFANQFNQLKINVESAGKDDPVDTGFINAFEPFQNQNVDKVSEIQQKGKEIKENFTQVAKYFGEDNNSLKRITSQEFYQQIHNVCKQIKVFISKEEAKQKKSKRF